MGFRFRKSISLGKGTRINLSKSGLGVSTGIKGFRSSIGPRGFRSTASIPGTGISYTTSEKQSGGRTPHSESSSSILDTGCLMPSLVIIGLSFWLLPFWAAVAITIVLIIIYWIA